MEPSVRLSDARQPVGARFTWSLEPDQLVVKESSRRELLVPVMSGTMASWKAQERAMLRGGGKGGGWGGGAGGVAQGVPCLQWLSDSE